LFSNSFVIESPLAPAQVAARLSAMTTHVSGFWSWVNFWMTWDGFKKTKFAGRIGTDSFELRRVHGVRLIAFVSVKARGEITGSGTGSTIAVRIGPTREEFWYLLLLLPIFLMAFSGSPAPTELALTLGLTVGLPLGWFFVSRSRESAQTEALVRPLLATSS
jgi:hypothetical protein